MRVLIINPPWEGKGYGTRSQNRIIKQRGDKYFQYPLFLGYAAAQLKEAGHEVFYIDSVIQEIDQMETCVEINRIKPDVIFMETTTPSIESDYRSINHMKLQTGAIMIAAGPHVSYFPSKSLEECNGLDIVIKREFDTKIATVLANLNDLSVVKGITYRNNKKIMDTGEGELFDNLDALPFPDRDIVPYNWYLEAWYSKRPFINIMTSRGCPYQCTFCLWPNAMYGHKQRTRSINNVIDELKYVIDRYGVKEVNIDDDTFTINKNRVIEFCHKLRDNNIRLIWTCNGRVDNVDEEMLKEMKASGCKLIRYGIESGSSEVLKKIKKGITIGQVERAITLTKKNGIQTLGGFMFGFPWDSKESIEATIELAKRISPDMVQFSIPMAYPGTQLYEEAKERGFILAEEWKEWDMTHGPVVETLDMNREELTPILARVYKEFYFRPRYIFQTLWNTTNYNEMRRVLRSLKSLLSTIKFQRNSKSSC